MSQPHRRGIATATAVGHCQIRERGAKYPDAVGAGLEIGDRIADDTAGADVEAFAKIDREETDPIPSIVSARP